MIQGIPVTKSLVKRPALITVLSILHLAGSSLFIIGFTLALLGRGFARANLLMLTAYGIPIVALVSGIGVLRGKTWGWWLGLFLYAAWIQKSLFILAIKAGIISTTDYFSLGSFGDYQYIYGIAIGALLIYAAVFFSFLHVKILNYFSLDNISKGKAICKAFAGAAIFHAIALVINT